jgi:hypothetical protein
MVKRGGYMLTTTKIKWLGCIIIAGVLVMLALIGGNWGKDYTANAQVENDPIIYAVLPPRVPVRSPDRVIVVAGLYFGTITDTWVRLNGNGVDVVLRPISIESDGVSVIVTDTLMTEPVVYNLTVVRSIPGTIPKGPFDPLWDVQSNVLDFTVFQAEEYFLPIIKH